MSTTNECRAKQRTRLVRRLIMPVAVVGLVVLTAGPASAHQLGQTTVAWPNITYVGGAEVYYCLGHQTFIQEYNGQMYSSATTVSANYYFCWGARYLPANYGFTDNHLYKWYMGSPYVCGWDDKLWVNGTYTNQVNVQSECGSGDYYGDTYHTINDMGYYFYKTPNHSH